jgi:hypothetical protein
MDLLAGLTPPDIPLPDLIVRAAGVEVSSPGADAPYLELAFFRGVNLRGQRGDALPGDTIPLHYHAARRRKEQVAVDAEGPGEGGGHRSGSGEAKSGTRKGGEKRLGSKPFSAQPGEIKAYYRMHREGVGLTIRNQGVPQGSACTGAC